MPTKTETFNQTQLKKGLPDIRPGDTVRVHQKFKEKGKEKSQMLEGLVIAKKHGRGVSSTITVRKVISGIGVEKIFPVHSPSIEKLEIVKRAKVKRAKLYYLRTAKGKKARLKRKELAEAIAWEEEKPTEKPKEETEKKEKPPTESTASQEAKSEEKPEEKPKKDKE